ncbi:DUF2127 domain-containing protein [Vibrio sp. Of14-4]|uniref:DUF2127 domain-containing protein n=1 Tax=Vibrio tetraodonis subsp. pristinus TaxID=2695891 RepID=A0A6L8LRG9_9VIBR|nr:MULTISPECIES: DUF2127 domain-containing protein [Vibrio]MCG7490243.1 DUF2127 domain-containing protein [Vibrio sp. Of14-4]MYM58681.1 DUF2127 domain-containing protein [Vibrio tetraodonis subsp. pristinus]
MQVETRSGLKVIAIVEALKGFISFAVVLGIYAFPSKDLRQLAELLVQHFHLNPVHPISEMLIDLSRRVPQLNMSLLMMIAVLYTVVRWIEAYGLWNEFRWTEWLALISCAIYIPFEIYAAINHPSKVSITLLIINLGIIAYIARTLYSKPESNFAAQN